jgi:hypothetical protein
LEELLSERGSLGVVIPAGAKSLDLMVIPAGAKSFVARNTIMQKKIWPRDGLRFTET